MEFGDYYEVRDWVEGFIPQVYGKEELGLARIEYLLNLLGKPQNKFKSIHVAGTNGKGSTAYYVARLLQYSSKSEIRNPFFGENGIQSETKSKFKIQNSKFSNLDIRASNLKPTKVGLHISPHLVDIRERMQVFESQSQSEKSSLMSMGRFLRLFGEIKPVVEEIQREKPDLTPSYFEILVAASFLYFAEEKVDWAVVEVGLGGRLDATNVLKPELSIITNIGLDHTEILGRTIAKISKEKAGIIKPVTTVITGATGKAMEVIKKVAKEKGSDVITIDTQQYPNGLTEFPKYVLLQNALLVLKVAEFLKIPISNQSIKKVFNIGFPGRFEMIDKEVVIDGAHNPDKIRCLIDMIGYSDYPIHQSSIILVVGFKRGKDWERMVDLLMNNLPIKKVITTQFWAVTDTGKFAAVEPNEIKDFLISNFQFPISNVKSIENSQQAVWEALQTTDYRLQTTVLITGSLYLVGEVRTMWQLPEF